MFRSSEPLECVPNWLVVEFFLVLKNLRSKDILRIPLNAKTEAFLKMCFDFWDFLLAMLVYRTAFICLAQ